jgi:Uncharacterized protein conserved in bacteria (DUF2252)
LRHETVDFAKNEFTVCGMRFLCALPLVFSHCLSACDGTQGLGNQADEADVTTQAKALSNPDFAAPLNRAFIRAASVNLASATFDAKWTAATSDSAVMFMRAFPGAYHKDLKQVPGKRVLGREGMCFGDPHPDNFGFLQLAGETRFVFNDLDDSGPCPVGLDAARYFAVLSLYFADKKLSADVLEQYVDTVKDPNQATQLNRSYDPDWAKVQADGLAAATQGDRLVLGATTELTAPSASERAAVMAAAAADRRLAQLTIKDVASLFRVSGGSGGLRRFWLLVANASGKRTIIELKETATPGVNLGTQRAALPAGERIAKLKKAFWNTSETDDYFEVPLLGGTFLVRDRFSKKSVNLSKLKASELTEVLRAQASEMARVHATAWQGIKKDDLRTWLDGSAQTLADRWEAAFNKRK